MIRCFGYQNALHLSVIPCWLFLEITHPKQPSLIHSPTQFCPYVIPMNMYVVVECDGNCVTVYIVEVVISVSCWWVECYVPLIVISFPDRFLSSPIFWHTTTLFTPLFSSTQFGNFTTSLD